MAFRTAKTEFVHNIHLTITASHRPIAAKPGGQKREALLYFTRHMSRHHPWLRSMYCNLPKLRNEERSNGAVTMVFSLVPSTGIRTAPSKLLEDSWAALRQVHGSVREAVKKTP